MSNFGAKQVKLPPKNQIEGYANKYNIKIVSEGGKTKGKKLTAKQLIDKIKRKMNDIRIELEEKTGKTHVSWTTEHIFEGKPYTPRPIETKIDFSDLFNALPEIKPKIQYKQMWEQRPEPIDKYVKKYRFPPGSKVRRGDKVSKHDIDEMIKLLDTKWSY